MLNAKSRVDAVTERLGLGNTISDFVAQLTANMLPQHLPARMNAFRDRYEHHLLLRMGSAGISEARDYLEKLLPSAGGAMFECTPEEGKAAFLHRFAVAGAAIRYRAIHAREVEDIVALDIALRRNDYEWVEHLPTEIDAKIAKKLYYGHFSVTFFTKITW